MVKDTKCVIKVRAPYGKGWVEFKECSSFAKADNWLCDYCRKNGYSITDFNIVRR